MLEILSSAFRIATRTDAVGRGAAACDDAEWRAGLGRRGRIAAPELRAETRVGRRAGSWSCALQRGWF